MAAVLLLCIVVLLSHAPEAEAYAGREFYLNYTTNGGAGWTSTGHIGDADPQNETGNLSWTPARADLIWVLGGHVVLNGSNSVPEWTLRRNGAVVLYQKVGTNTGGSGGYGGEMSPHPVNFMLLDRLPATAQNLTGWLGDDHSFGDTARASEAYLYSYPIESPYAWYVNDLSYHQTSSTSMVTVNSTGNITAPFINGTTPYTVYVGITAQYSYQGNKNRSYAQVLESVHNTVLPAAIDAQRYVQPTNTTISCYWPVTWTPGDTYNYAWQHASGSPYNWTACDRLYMWVLPADVFVQTSHAEVETPIRSSSMGGLWTVRGNTSYTSINATYIEWGTTIMGSTQWDTYARAVRFRVNTTGVAPMVENLYESPITLGNITRMYTQLMNLTGGPTNTWLEAYPGSGSLSMFNNSRAASFCLRPWNQTYADFMANASVVESGSYVQLYDASAGPAPTEYRWQINGVNVSTDDNPVVQLNVEGWQNITQWINSTSGPSSKVRNYMIWVTPVRPTADFTADTTSGDAPLTVQLTDTSLNGPTAWAWQIDDGDGYTANYTSQNPAVTLPHPGTYTVTLTVSNSGGSSGKQVADYLTANAPVPNATFTVNVTHGPCPLAVLCTDTSTGWPTTITWAVNGTNVTTGSTAVLIFTNISNYTLRMYAENARGMSYVETTITAGTVTAIIWSSASGKIEPGTLVNFSAINCRGPPSDYVWISDDGWTATGLNASHIFAAQGRWNVTLTCANFLSSDVSDPLALDTTPRSGMGGWVVGIFGGLIGIIAIGIAIRGGKQ